MSFKLVMIFIVFGTAAPGGKNPSITTETTSMEFPCFDMARAMNGEKEITTTRGDRALMVTIARCVPDEPNNSTPTSAPPSIPVPPQAMTPKDIPSPRNGRVFNGPSPYDSDDPLRGYNPWEFLERPR